MQTDDKNTNDEISINAGDKNSKSSHIGNDDIMIGPIGVSPTPEASMPEESVTASVELKPEVKQSSGQEPVQPVMESQQEEVIKKDDEVKIEAKKEENVFDMRLDQLKKSIKKGGKLKIKKEKVSPVIKEELKPLKHFIIKEEKKKSIVLTLSKNIVLSLIALGLFLVNLYFDNSALIAQDSFQDSMIINIPQNETITISKAGEVNLVTDMIPLETGTKIETKESSNSEIHFPGNGVIRLDANTNIDIKKTSKSTDSYEFKLNNGKIWGDLRFDDYDLSISTKNALIKPGNSAFNIETEESKTNVYSNKHDVYIGLTHNSEIINSFYLAEGNQVNITHSKVEQEAETIKKLLYSKLAKEFSYSKISQKTLNENSWLSSQIEKDNSYKDKISIEFFDNLRDKGLKTLSPGSIRFHAKSLMSDLRSVFIFSESKEMEIILDSIFENIHDAEYLYFQGNNIDGDVRISLFAQDISNPSYSQSEIFNENLYERITDELHNILFVIPGDDLYPIKSELLNQLFGIQLKDYIDKDDQFRYLAYKINDVYDSININTADAGTAFAEYFDIYKQIKRTYKNNLFDIQDQILRNNIIVDNLLFSSPELYKIEFFESKKQMENDYLATLTSGVDKKEQRQTLISNKIDLLSRIRYFLFQEDLTPEDSRQIVFILIRDIEELQGDTLSVAAVNELFEKRLKDFGVFWQYLNSPEYSSSPLHGASHNERFEEFKKVQEEILTFEDVKEEILGEVELEELEVDDVTKQAEKDLEDAGISEIKFGFYNDVTITKIPILSAKAVDIEFRATYDWDRKLLSNIIVGEDLISTEGVKLSNANKFISETVGSLTEIVEVPVTETEIEIVEKDPLADVKNAAKVFLVEKFTKIGMKIDINSISIVDFNKGEYAINNVYFEEKPEAKFSFNYLTKDDKISELTIQTDEGEKSVDDTFTSTFIKRVVLKIYEEAEK